MTKTTRKSSERTTESMIPKDFSKKPSKLEVMAWVFKDMKKGTILEVTVKNGKMKYTTVGYYAGIRELDGEKYLTLDKYKKEGHHECIMGSTTHYLRLIRSYHIKA